jgi:hypothetical protein
VRMLVVTPTFCVCSFTVMDETLSLASDDSTDEVHPIDRVSLVGPY